jgi:hypothetical protein
VRVVDEHVRAAVERLRQVGLQGHAERRAAQGLADVAAGLAARDRRVQAQVVRRDDARDELAADGAEGARDADREGVAGDRRQRSKKSGR